MFHAGHERPDNAFVGTTPVVKVSVTLFELELLNVSAEWISLTMPVCIKSCPEFVGYGIVVVERVSQSVYWSVPDPVSRIVQAKKGPAMAMGI